MKITAAVVPARGAPFEVQSLDLESPQAGEVLVRIVASGMCHTDLHARDGYFPNLPYPVVCGHEGAGVVEAVGGGVTDLAAGDPVVISFPWCGECEPCRADLPSYCVAARSLKSSGRRADGSTPMSRDGEPVYSCFFQQSSFATFAVTPAKDVVKLRRDAPVEMLGPLGCGLQTGAGAVLNVMRPPPGRSIAVFGVGGVGLAGLMAARIAGCDPIVAVDRLPARLALARELGATHALESSGEATLAEIRRITGGGVHYAFEAIGTKNTAEQSFQMLRPGGTATIIGMVPFGVKIELHGFDFLRDRKIQGTSMGGNRFRVDMPRLLSLWKQGRLKLDHLITGRIKLDQINDGFAALKSAVPVRQLIDFAA